MKNLTLTLDDETWRKARVAAAQRGTSLSAMVRDWLVAVTSAVPGDADKAAALFAVLDRAGPYRATERLSRDEIHERR